MMIFSFCLLQFSLGQTGSEPEVTSALVDAYGFEWTTVIFAILYCAGIIFNVIELSYTCIVQKESFWIKSESSNYKSQCVSYNVSGRQLRCSYNGPIVSQTTQNFSPST